MFEKQQFGHRSPSLHEMIPKISAAIDQRFLLRKILTGNKRIKYYHPDPRFQTALEDASWCLNPIGMKLLFTNLKLLEKRWNEMSIEDVGGVTETFEKHEAKTYKTTGGKCDCSYFHQMYYCRHIPFYRLQNCLPVFELAAFHPSLTKDGQTGSGDEDDRDISPPSPGMEMVMSEEKRQRKNPSQAKKFNLSIDVGKEMAEVISTYETRTFEETLEASKDFVKAVRRGISKELKEYLKCPEKFQIVPLVLHGQGNGEDSEPASQTINYQVTENMELVEEEEDFANHLEISSLQDDGINQPESSCEEHKQDSESQIELSERYIQRSSVFGCSILNSPTMGSSAVGNYNLESHTMDSPSAILGRSTLTSSTMDSPAMIRSTLNSPTPTLNSPTPILGSSTLTSSTEGISTVGRSALNSSNLGGPSLVTGITSCMTCANIKCLAKRTPERALSLCSGCSGVAYCGRKCQKEGWIAHNMVCKTMNKKNWDTRIQMVTLMIQHEIELNNTDNRLQQTQSPAPDCSQNQLSPTEGLPDISYTPQSNILRSNESIKFLEIIKKKGRPQMKRLSKFSAKTKTMSEEVLDFFPKRDKSKDKPKQRKTRTDKGKKRGRNKSEQLEHVVKLRAPRAPKNMEALHREFGDIAAPKCGTCDLPLNFKEAENDEQVVSCKKCRSFIHRACEEFCVSCD